MTQYGISKEAVKIVGVWTQMETLTGIGTGTEIGDEAIGDVTALVVQNMTKTQTERSRSPDGHRKSRRHRDQRPETERRHRSRSRDRRSRTAQQPHPPNRCIRIILRNNRPSRPCPPLPDIPLVIIFASSNIPTLLACESVCKQWSTIIRNTQVAQVWKPTLVQGFPEGCLPVLQGHENYRDVTLLWYAWSRPWRKYRVAEPRTMEEIDVGETILQKDTEVVRDLAALPTDAGMESLGCHADGRTVLHPKRCSWALSKLPIHDIVFTEAKTLPFSRRIDYIDPTVQLSRTDFIPRRTEKGEKRFFENWRTGEKVSSVAVAKGNRKNQPFDRPYVTVCGNVQISADGERKRGPHDKINVTRIVPSNGNVLHSSSAITDYGRPQSIAHNEHLLAYAIPRHSNRTGCMIFLLRLDDCSEIGYTRHAGPGLYLRMSRFNLFVIAETVCDVYDLTSLKHLYTIKSFPSTSFGLDVLANDQLILHAGHGKFEVGDPFTQNFRELVAPYEDMWMEEDFCENRADGYAVITKEYPIYPNEVRTGERGRTEYYWRKMRCCGEGKIGKKCRGCDSSSSMEVDSPSPSGSNWRGLITRMNTRRRIVWRRVGGGRGGNNVVAGVRGLKDGARRRWVKGRGGRRVSKWKFFSDRFHGKCGYLALSDSDVYDSDYGDESD
ncbi:hypothetical protein HDV00_002057 [Rhizophlyctis rosea]|nr:hypothetical protein HDV00_002057 [Rhizophlyctis rosea]